MLITACCLAVGLKSGLGLRLDIVSRRLGSNSTWLDSTRHVRLCRASRASRDERVEPDEPRSSNMADDERSCTSLVVFMLLHTQILFFSSNKIN